MENHRAHLADLRMCLKSCPFCLGKGEVRGEGGVKQCPRATSPHVNVYSPKEHYCWSGKVEDLLKLHETARCPSCDALMVHGRIVLVDDFSTIYDPEDDYNPEEFDDCLEVDAEGDY